MIPLPHRRPVLAPAIDASTAHRVVHATITDALRAWMAPTGPDGMPGSVALGGNHYKVTAVTPVEVRGTPWEVRVHIADGTRDPAITAFLRLTDSSVVRHGTPVRTW